MVSTLPLSRCCLQSALMQCHQTSLFWQVAKQHKYAAMAPIFLVIMNTETWAAFAQIHWNRNETRNPNQTYWHAWSWCKILKEEKPNLSTCMSCATKLIFTTVQISKLNESHGFACCKWLNFGISESNWVKNMFKPLSVWRIQQPIENIWVFW